jgi:1-acyl-sn-glycerol-3-phosphate acyltransferase
MLCRVLGVTFKVRGRPPKTTCLYAANHLGYLDVFVLGALYKSQFLSMAEVAGWPFIGFLARRAGTLFIDRKRLRDVPRVRAEMAQYLARGISVTFFPEGRPSPGLTVEALRPSLLDVALGAGVAVVPVALSYETRGDPRPPSLTVCWWGDMDFAPHFLRLLSMTGIEVTVAFGEALEANGDRKALARALRERILAEFTPVRQG